MRARGAVDLASRDRVIGDAVSDRGEEPVRAAGIACGQRDAVGEGEEIPGVDVGADHPGMLSSLQQCRSRVVHGVVPADEERWRALTWLAGQRRYEEALSGHMA